MRTYRTVTHKAQTGCGELRVRIAYKGDESFHFLLASLDSHSNACGGCWLEIVSNSLTYILRRAGGDVEPVIKHFKGQRCEYGLQGCPNAIAKVLQEAFNEKADK